MREDLVSFETAKLAKEKGFNIPTLYGCNEKGELQEYITYASYSPGEPEITIFDFIQIWKYQLPTQSLLQKWLREIHSINNLNIYPVYHNKVLSGYGYWRGILGMDNLYLFNKQPLYPTYEEALEEGLFSALKLIKI